MKAPSHLSRFLVFIIPWCALLGCPPDPPSDGLPSCEDLSCQGGSVCLDGACRPRACVDLDCPQGQVCQGGPLCVLASIAEDPPCSDVICIEGYVCQPGPMCRDALEDLDGDGVRSQLDCDDGHPLRYPGNAEVCDGIDNDCNGAPDNDAPCPEGRRCCGESGCIDPVRNREHCGACGRECDIYEECEESVCREASSPVLESLFPTPLPTGVWFGRDDNAPLVLEGEGLLGYATVYIESVDGTSSLDPFEVVTSSSGRAYTNDQPVLIDGEQLPAGPATLWVVRNDGEESNRLDIEVVGAEPPVVTSVSPVPVQLASEITFSVYGSGYWGEPELLISPDGIDWVDLPVQWVDPTWIRTDTIILNPAFYPAGTWVVVVRNPDRIESVPFPFDVEAAPAPVVTGIDPTEVRLGGDLILRVYGYGFFGTPTVMVAPEDDPENPLPSLPLDSVDARRLVTEPVVVSPGLFSPMPYLVWVENPDEVSSNRVRIVVLE